MGTGLGAASVADGLRPPIPSYIPNSATFRSARSRDKLVLRACLFRYEMAIMLRPDRDPAGRG